MNENNILKAKELMEEGWRAREELDFDEAEDLLSEARVIFEDEGDWFNVTECLNHLAYCHRMEARQTLAMGVDSAQAALEIAREHGTKEVHAIRALTTLSEASGEFEKALDYSEMYLELADAKADSGDIQAHAAFYKMRTGHIEDALTIIESALEDLKKGWDSASEPHKYIWKSSALGRKALICYNLGNFNEALDLAEEGLRIAKENDLKSRIQTLGRLVDYISDKQI